MALHREQLLRRAVRIADELPGLVDHRNGDATAIVGRAVLPQQLEQLFLAANAAAALGVAQNADPGTIKSAALNIVEHWRQRASDPMADPTFVEVCETAARTGEALYAQAG